MMNFLLKENMNFPRNNTKLNLVNKDLLYTKGDSINVLKNNIIISKPNTIIEYLSIENLLQKLNNLKLFFGNLFQKFKSYFSPNVVMVFTMIFVMYLLFIIANYS